VWVILEFWWTAVIHPARNGLLRRSVTHAQAQERGLPCATRVYAGNDPLGFILAMNLHRRHLNESQRAMVAAKLANMTHGGDRRVQQDQNSDVARADVSLQQAADLSGPLRTLQNKPGSWPHLVMWSAGEPAREKYRNFPQERCGFHGPLMGRKTAQDL
jgi:hypothetical protein